MRGIDDAMLPSMLTCGTADEIGDAVQPFFDAGLDGLIFNMPAGSTPEMVDARGLGADRAFRNVTATARKNVVSKLREE